MRITPIELKQTNYSIYKSRLLKANFLGKTTNKLFI